MYKEELKPIENSEKGETKRSNNKSVNFPEDDQMPYYRKKPRTLNQQDEDDGVIYPTVPTGASSEDKQSHPQRFKPHSSTTDHHQTSESDESTERESTEHETDLK
jgi:hypothetical protein